jgi:ABC-2 type transport system ATP-binding protein
MESERAISVEGVSKVFKLPHEKRSSVKSVFINVFRRDKGYDLQSALKNVTFTINKGEFFGIVGRNGSGKSTLLKLLAGIYAPTRGTVQVNGSLTPFIELGVGFNPELTGRENVYLNGALLGFNRKEMHEMYKDIVEFAELEKFMDQKLKNYSSGMQVRLAFSIAIRAQSDILLIDEVLAVGDYAFQQKCYEYFKFLKSIGKTVVLVSHDANALQMFCDKGILIDDGHIQKEGTIQEVLEAYSKQIVNRQEQHADSQSSPQPESQIEGGEIVKLKQVYCELDGHKKQIFRPHDKITVVYEVEAMQMVKDPVIGLVLQDASGGAPIFATNTLDSNQKTGLFNQGEKKRIRFTLENNFNDTKLYISGAISNSDRSQIFVRFFNTASFRTSGWNNTAKGTVYLPYKLEIDDY